LNIAFETRIADTRSLEDIVKSIDQFCSEINHGCESCKINKSRPLIELLASPLKFLVETLNSLLTKIRGIIHTVKLTKLINFLVSVEDILIKEGFQHNSDAQAQVEKNNILPNTVNIYTYNFLNLLIIVKNLKKKNFFF